MRLRILSRASALAQRQARQVAAALRATHPSLDVTLHTRVAAGDRDIVTPLARFADKGAFTSDLSGALVSGDADLVVHSWKDLPIESTTDTVIGATLQRADPRDALLVRTSSVEQRPPVLRVLTSSPRRNWMLTRSLAPLLPWPIESVTTCEVRGNITTRLRKLLDGDADALVVAKAALDRLLDEDDEDAESSKEIRGLLDRCRWMVLPLRTFPTAPAQGALAIEVAAGRMDVRERLGAIQHADTWVEVQRERALLAQRGGGCHDAFGATATIRPYGIVLSTRGRYGDDDQSLCRIERAQPAHPRAAAADIWPAPTHDRPAVRRALNPTQPSADAYFVARAEAWPDGWRASERTVVWVAGSRTWTALAARGLWVNGSTDGLGDDEIPRANLLAGRTLSWLRLTHTQAPASPARIATYEVERVLPADLDRYTHFFWTSGAEFTRALAAHPRLAEGWHGSGPGATSRAIAAALGSTGRAAIWLDYDHWISEISA